MLHSVSPVTVGVHNILSLLRTVHLHSLRYGRLVSKIYTEGKRGRDMDSENTVQVGIAFFVKWILLYILALDNCQGTPPLKRLASVGSGLDFHS